MGYWIAFWACVAALSWRYGVAVVRRRIRAWMDRRRWQPSRWARTWYVDPEAGDDANDGLTPMTAKRNWLAAIEASGRGDVIVVRPPSTEIDNVAQAGWRCGG